MRLPKQIISLLSIALILSGAGLTVSHAQQNPSSTVAFEMSESTTVTNTDELKEAIEKGGNIYIANGTYDVGTLTISKSVNLVGTDKKATIINGKIAASGDVISNLNISNLTINSENQHLALWQNTNVKSVNVDSVTFNHLKSENQATMYFWGSFYDLVSVTNCEFNYPNAGTGTDVVNLDGEVVDRAFVGQVYDADKLVFSNNIINKDAKATIRKGFELSGFVKDFNANNNSFNKTRYAIYAWLWSYEDFDSSTSSFILNNNKFNNCTTAGITIEGYTGKSLGSLKCNTNKYLKLVNSEVLKGNGNKGNKN